MAGAGVRVAAGVGVAVGVLVAVRVLVGVLVGVFVGVAVLVGGLVGVLVGISVGVLVDVAVGVLVGVFVGVLVGRLVDVAVAVGVGSAAFEDGGIVAVSRRMSSSVRSTGVVPVDPMSKLTGALAILWLALTAKAPPNGASPVARKASSSAALPVP